MKDQLANQKPLSIPDLVTALEACRANARELLEEADLLLQAGRQARGYTLIHTACEELAKFFMFEMAGKRVAQRNAPNWKRFWQRLRAHDSKIAQAMIRVHYKLSISPEDRDDPALAGLQLFERGLTPRNSSMYVELGPDGGFRKPSDIDWRIGVEALKGVAIHLLHTAEHLGSTSGIEAALHEPASMDEQRAALTLLTGTIENLRAAGMDQEAVKAAINKVLKAADRT